MYCNKCGNKLNYEDSFCSKCGNKINNISENLQQNNKDNPQSYIKKKKFNTKITGIGPGIAFIIFIVLICIFINSIFSTKNTSYSVLNDIGLNESQIDSVNNIIKQCGYEKYTLTRDASLDNLESKGSIGFRINSSQSNGILYMKKNKVEAIRYADKYLYKDGKVKNTLSNFIVTLEEQIFIKSQVENSIKELLKSPSTAKFPSLSNWDFSKKDGTITVTSYVDSQNSFGAIIRADFKVKIKKDTITYLCLDGTEYIK